MKPTREEIEAAMQYAVAEDYDRQKWKDAERVLVSAGLCPSCACDGRRVHLLPWEPGSAHEYAGRPCPECEEFFPCGDQDDGYKHGDYAGALGADNQVYSDADPGL